MRHGAARVCACAVLWVSAAVHAQEWPPIREIAFEGNKTTRSEVMLREVTVRVGQPADPARLERSRQGILDLGLFRRAGVRTEPLADGGVRVVFTVKEKFYILPVPRIEGNSDRQFGLGGQLRWNNFLGRNHTVRTFVIRRDPNEADRGSSDNYVFSYSAPLVWDSPYSLSFSASHSTQEILQPAVYEQASQSYSVRAERTYAAGPASQGLTLGLGLSWNEQTNEGIGAPPESGEATAIAVSANYNDVRFRVYSEEGETYGVRSEIARKGLLSDYDSAGVHAHWNRRWRVGQTAHQTVHLLTSAGLFGGGGAGRLDGAFALGGSGDLRGYPRDFVEGDAFYLAALEYLRPIGWPWLRGLVLLEAGDAAVGRRHSNLRGPYLSAGIGIRLRVPQFVGLEVQIGMGWPLIRGDGDGRVFAGGV